MVYNRTMNDYSKNLKGALKRVGLTDEFMLKKIEEWIKAIKTGEYKPRNKEKKLQELTSHREELLEKIKNRSS